MTMPILTERVHDGDVDDPPAPDRPQRRRFTADYKLAILADYDRMRAKGEKGALLRREGLHTSHIVEWRRAREAGVLRRTGSAATSSEVRSRNRACRSASCSSVKRLVIAAYLT